VATVVHATTLVDACPRAAVRWIDACGHFPQIEHAAVVNEWLGEFLATRAAAR
jgi:pimeloyl-ACP methyl ester carboxylesterase